MSVITKLSAVPNRLEQFWLYLAVNAPKGMPKPALEHLFSPPSLGKGGDGEGGDAGGNIFNAVLSESQALGFVAQAEKDYAIVPLLPPDGKGSLEQKRQWFFEELRRIVTTPVEAKEKKQEDVALALAWVALQSPDQPISFGATQSGRIDSAFHHNETHFGLNTTARIQQCYYWARYLGLCTFSVGKDGKPSVVPDSTAAVRSLLPAIFGDTHELTASMFLSLLGNHCPVLERGEARRNLLSLALRPQGFPKDDELSGGTGLALLRLEAKGVIELDDRSDALEPCMITVCSCERRFSHIRLGGGGRGNA